MSEQPRYDSVIFDMDGTLWDAVDTYCVVWNTIFERMGIRRRLQRTQLLGYMGLPLEEIFARVCHGLDGCDPDEYLRQLKEAEPPIVRRLGGRVYPGVRATLATLKARGVRLYMASNCSLMGIDNFLAFTGLGDLFDDTITQGHTGCDKAHNIRLLIERHRLQRPLYVGDIEADAREARLAAVPFCWAAYGFGHNVAADHAVHAFPDLLNILSDDSDGSDISDGSDTITGCQEKARAEPESSESSDKIPHGHGQ